MLNTPILKKYLKKYDTINFILVGKGKIKEKGKVITT